MEENTNNKQGRKVPRVSQAPEPITPPRGAGATTLMDFNAPVQTKPTDAITIPDKDTELFTITGDQFIGEGGAPQDIIEQYMLDHGLPVWDSITYKIFNINNDKYGYWKGELSSCLQEGPFNRFIFRQSDVLKYQKRYMDSLAGQERGMVNLAIAGVVSTGEETEWRPAAGTSISNPTRQEVQSYNFLTRNGDIWHIGFGHLDVRIKHLNGLLFIAFLLGKPGGAISCRELFTMAGSGNEPDNIMSESAAIGEGLNIGSSKQEVGNAKNRKICWEEYQRLQEKLPNAGIEEQADIQEKMDKLMQFLNQKERIFTDPNDKKAQANAKKRLAAVYAAMKKAGMEQMSKHLQNHIKPDGAFGLRYTGSLVWKTTI
jgi:hypothetical protein